MKRTRRFKQVATELTKPIVDDNDATRPSRRVKSVTVRAEPEPSSGPSTSELPVGEMTILPSKFFQIDAVDLAPRLLGKFLRRDDVVLRITEVIFSLQIFVFCMKAI